MYRDGLAIPLPNHIPGVFLEKTEDGLAVLVERFVRTRGPFTTFDLSSRFGLSAPHALAELESIEKQGRVMRGPFTPSPRGAEWCDVDALRRIRKASLFRARGGVQPVESRDYARFLSVWHGVASVEAPTDDSGGALIAAIEQLQGCPLPASALEVDILASRVSDYRPLDLDLLAARGEVVLEGRGALGLRDGKVALYLAPNRVLLGRPSPDPLKTDLHQRVRSILQLKGALFLPEIAAFCAGVRPTDIVDALWGLFWNGEVTNDSVAALRARTTDPARSPGRRFVAAHMRRYRSRVDIPADGAGRFSMLSPHPGESVESRLATIEQWLQRHGVLTREAIQAEANEGGFGAVYPILRALEERGQLRRGYFIEGPGALQFADPFAVDRMRELKASFSEARAAVLAATDPANPFGMTLPWPPWCDGKGERRARQHVVIADGELTALLFADGARVQVHQGDAGSDGDRRARLSAQAIVRWMRRRALRIIGHEGVSSPLNAGALAKALSEAGLTPSGPGFRL
ncbi:MAG: hypothetical protein JJE39_08215 [Vicinamibacteria bacterium]|nr:hypothetical protein [Vicinamibacteria bacterium]